MLPELSSAQYLEDFLTGLLEEAGMEDLSPAVHEQLMKDLRTRLNERLFGTIIASLEEDDLTAFRKLIDGGAPPEEVGKFFDAHVENAAEVMAAALEAFRTDYLGLNPA